MGDYFYKKCALPRKQQRSRTVRLALTCHDENVVHGLDALHFKGAHGSICSISRAARTLNGNQRLGLKGIQDGFCHASMGRRHLS